MKQLIKLKKQKMFALDSTIYTVRLKIAINERY